MNGLLLGGGTGVVLLLAVMGFWLFRKQKTRLFDREKDKRGGVLKFPDPSSCVLEFQEGDKPLRAGTGSGERGTGKKSRDLYFECGLDLPKDSSIFVQVEDPALTKTGSGTEIKLNDPEFDNNFYIMTDDEFMARAYLDPAVRHTLTRYKDYIVRFTICQNRLLFSLAFFPDSEKFLTEFIDDGLMLMTRALKVN